MLLRIGELARRAGVTVRTLRHYEALGLLRPTSRTPGGGRVYGQADAMRLHAVLALKQFGCSLAEIRALLDEGGAALPDILARQIAALTEQAVRAAALGEKLTRLRGRLVQNEDTAMADWLETLALMHVYSRYFTEAELDTLRRNKDAAGRRREVWAAIVAAMAGGAAPDGEAGLAIAHRVADLARQSTGQDAALAGKLRELFRGEESARQAVGLTVPMLRWLEQALDAARERRAAGGARETAAPWQTALGMAMLRAAHQLLDAPPVFDDPFSLRIIGRQREAALRADPGRYDMGELRGVRVSGALRSQVAADAWAEARADGVAQHVALGAGLDTTPWREAGRGGGFFEVDHPATQAFKRSLLAEAGMAEDAAVFVPTDFETARLADVLAGAGLDCAAPVFFTWLGVTMYLERATVRAVLAWIATLPPGTRIVFDYAVDPALLSERERQGRAAVTARTAARGEPWKSDFAPAQLAAILGGLGFGRVDDPGPRAHSARYLARRADGLRKSGVTRIVQAIVTGGPS